MIRLNIHRFDGWKTRIGVLAMFVVGGLLATHTIDQQTYEMLMTFVGGFTAYGIHDAVVRNK